MKGTPTQSFLNYAAAAGKVVRWRAYIRKVSVLNTALSSGTWTEVTNRLVDLDDVETALEFDVAMQAANSLSYHGVGIAWWDANVFDATASEYIEFKVTGEVGATADSLASDVWVLFSGFVDKNVSYSELDDTVDFRVADALEMMNELDAVNVTTQYLATSVDGAGTDGLYLFSIPGVYVTDCAIASYNLKVGTHTVTYDWNNGAQQMKLDDGEWVSVATSGSKTLVNGDADQKVTAYVVNTSALPQSIDTISEYLVVTTGGDTLCKQFYRNISTKRLIQKMYATVGIDNVTFGTMTIPTNDGSSRVSYIELPPNDETVNGSRYAMATDGTDLFIGIGQYLYKRDASDGSYTEIVDLGSGVYVFKLFYNARNDQLWILYTGVTIINDPNDADIDDSTPTMYLRRYTVGTDTMSSEVTLTGTAPHTFAVFDYNYTGSSYKYGVFYVHTADGTVKFVDGSALTTSSVAPTYAAQNGWAYVNGASYCFQTNDAGALSYWYFNKITCDASGTLSDGGLVVANANADGRMVFGAYVSSENRAYWWDLATGKVRCQQLALAASAADVTDLGTDDNVMQFVEYSATLYFTALSGGLYSAASGSATALDLSTNAFTQYCGLAFVGSALYGSATAGLWQYSTNMWLFVPDASLRSGTVRRMMQMALGTWLVSTVSTKRAFVYRRSDDAGTPETSGNTMTVTTRQASDLHKESKYVAAYDVVRLTNGTTSNTYDGTNFGVDASSTQRVMEIENSFVPDNMVKDLLKQLFAFFGTDRDLYRVDCGALPLYQFEIFDELDVTFTTTKITKTATGPIYGVTFSPDGSMSVRALL